MTTSTELVICKRLKKMVKMAQELRQCEDFNSKEYAQRNNYVRIGGESFRAVSLFDSYPLCGIGKSGSRKLATVLGHFEKAVNSNSKRELNARVLDHKKERRLQCWLVREALLNDGSLIKPLNLGKEHFDELWFALDEVSIGDKSHPINDLAAQITLSPEQEGKKMNAVRCDILAVGVIGKEVFPVVIELKSKRDKDRLQKQLNNFENLLKYKHFEPYFSDLLEACTGLKINSNCRKIIIWPALNEKNNKTVTAIHKNGIDLIEYSDSYGFNHYFNNV